MLTQLSKELPRMLERMPGNLVLKLLYECKPVGTEDTRDVWQKECN
jgi:hypothetical protein